MANKEHLSESGLLKILSLKSVLNNGLTEETKKLTDKKIDILVRPLFVVNSEDFNRIAPHWISGFTDGDGSFSIRISQKVNSKTFNVAVRFRLTQHIRDVHLLGVIVEYFGCGQVYTRATKLACDLQISGISDINMKVIPLFKKCPLRTVKEKDFKDFSLVAGYILTKKHMTPEGLALIRVLKSNMNNFREHL